MSAGNPFSRHLRRVSRPPAAVGPFADAWDRLETLVVDVYRRGETGEADDDEFAALKSVLLPAHARLSADLEPHWRASRVGRQLAGADPFAALLAVERAEGFVGNAEMLRQLPAAREALNRWILSHTSRR
jgi:hypothetical protein